MDKYKRLVAVVGVVVASAAVTNIYNFEGNKYVPYYDGANVLTVCAGVTKPLPIKNKVYTKEECNILNEGVITEHAEKSLVYLPPNAKDGHKLLAILAGYNLGPKRIKDRGLPDMIKRGDPTACSALVKYHFVAN